MTSYSARNHLLVLLVREIFIAGPLDQQNIEDLETLVDELVDILWILLD